MAFLVLPSASVLVGTDHFARHVEGEPLFVVRLHTLDEIIIGDREAVLLGGEQVVNRHPSRPVVASALVRVGSDGS